MSALCPFAAAVCPLSVLLSLFKDTVRPVRVGLHCSPTRRDNRTRHQTAPERTKAMLVPMTARCLKLTDSDVPGKKCARDGGQNIRAKHDSPWMKISRRSEPLTGQASPWRFLCHLSVAGLSLRLAHRCSALSVSLSVRCPCLVRVRKPTTPPPHVGLRGAPCVIGGPLKCRWRRPPPTH